MKILIIKGSPHARWSSALLAERFKQGAEASGHLVKEFDAGHALIRGCLACEHCHLINGNASNMTIWTN